MDTAEQHTLTPPFTVHRDEFIRGPFQWVVRDSAGRCALWQPHPKVGEVPMRFRTYAAAQGAANRLNAKQKTYG
jgi:hypothetical protein